MFSFKNPLPLPKSHTHNPSFNWLMFTLLVLLPLIIIPAFIITVSVYGSWAYYGTMFLITYALCILSIGVYHRYWTHKSFEFKENKGGKFVSLCTRLFGIVFGCLAGQGDAISWVLRHWKHHLVEDVVGEDHHTPLEFENKFLGFIWSHVGWMCYLDIEEFDYTSHSDSKRQELEKDSLLVWQQKNYAVLYTFFATAFPVIIACILSRDFWLMLQGELFNLSTLLIHIALTFLTINAARMASQHATFFVNSLCHISGSKPYQNHKTGEAKDNWLVAILVFGEGFHNGHHAFGYSYEHGLRHDGNLKTWRRKLMYTLDIHARIIDGLDRLGFLNFKLKPSDSEVSMVMQKKILFDLERKLKTLSIEFSKKKGYMQDHLSQEIDNLKGKLGDVSDEYKKALELLVLKLQNVIETCKERIEFYKNNRVALSNMWMVRLKKAEKELVHFQVELKNLSSVHFA